MVHLLVFFSDRRGDVPFSISASFLLLTCSRRSSVIDSTRRRLTKIMGG